MAKNKNTYLLLLLLIGGVVVSFQRPSLEQVYLSQIGVQEQPRGSNWGPEVKQYLKSVKINSPAPWCAAVVHWCLDSAGIKNTVTAYSPTAHNRKNLVYFKGKWLRDFLPGDVFTIYYVKMGRIAHTGFGHRMINSKIVETVEGNTNNDGSRDGYIMCKRRRSLHSLYSFSRWQ